jgi:hypothetical protein
MMHLLVEFKEKKNYYVGTLITKEYDLNLYYRTLTKIYKYRKIEFVYGILNHNENFFKVKFYYLDGSIKIFINSLQKEYYYCTKISNTNDLPKEFKIEYH